MKTKSASLRKKAKSPQKLESEQIRNDFESRYRIESLLGSGGAGDVHLAYDYILKRPVAIKRLKVKSQSEDSPAELLVNEAQALCQIQHPNIVSIYDIGVDKDDCMFLVMEYLDGFDFELLTQDGYLLYDQFYQLAIQSLEGLVAAHSMGVLHLDIKPANLMLIWLPSGQLHVKIVDFGLARITAKMDSFEKSTRSLELQGSIYFMSPEQMNQEELTEVTDLYSLGCLFYYALSGHYPFDGDSSIQVMASHLMHRFTPLATYRPDLPEWLCSWVESLFNQEPERRPKSSLEALDLFLKKSRHSLR